MGKITGIFVLALMAVLCTGCLDYTEDMVIKADGSGTLSMHVAMDKTYLKAMEQMAKEMAVALGTDTTEMESPTGGFSRDKIEQALATGGQGVRLLSIDSSETDASKIWDLKFAFDDINQAYTAMAALQAEEEDAMIDDEADVDDETEAAEDVPLTFVQQADGTWLFERQLNDEDDMGAGLDDEYESETEIEELAPVDSDDEADDESGLEAGMNEEEDDSDVDAEMEDDDFSEAMADMMAGLGDHTIRFTVTFPGDIVESNATSVNGRAATWEFKLAESMKFSSMHAVIRK